jgi:hypothetical protein
MPVLFLHGVNTRRGVTLDEQNAFDQRITLMLEQFRKITFAGIAPENSIRTFAPYWGDMGASFAWKMASIPQPDTDQRLGGSEYPLGQRGTEALLSVIGSESLRQVQKDSPEQSLLNIAREMGLSVAVDALIAAAPSSQSAKPDDISSLAVFSRAAVPYAWANQKPEWLNAANVTNDESFTEELLVQVSKASNQKGKDQALGAGDVFANIRNLLTDVAGEIGHTVVATLANTAGDLSRPFINKIRPSVTTLLGQFIGDIVIYQEGRGDRGHPTGIAEFLVNELRKADAARSAEDSKLIIIGHSLGGVVAYDLLSHFAPDIVCDLFITAGSQVAMFEELKRFRASDPAIHDPDGRVERPANISCWINTYDLTDVLGFSTKGVFKDDPKTENFEFDTDAAPIVSHGAYFDSAQFYHRLRVRTEAILAL